MVTNPCREHKAHKTGWHGRLVQLPKQQRREIRSSQPVSPSPTKQTLPLPPTELQRSQGVHCPVASELLYCRNGTNYPLHRRMLAPPDEPERPATVYDPGIRYYAVYLAEQLHEGNNSRLRGPVLQLYILYQRYCTAQVPHH